MPTLIAVRCPHCQSHQIVKRSQSARGTQRYLCQNPACASRRLLLDYRNRGGLPQVKQLIIDMSLHASGVRDTARSLHMSTDTVLGELKKKEPALESVNTALLRTLKPEAVTVDIREDVQEVALFVMLPHLIHHDTDRMIAHAGEMA